MIELTTALFRGGGVDTAAADAGGIDTASDVGGLLAVLMFFVVDFDGEAASINPVPTRITRGFVGIVVEITESTFI